MHACSPRPIVETHMGLSRRSVLKLGLGLGAARLADVLLPQLAGGFDVIRKPIPSTGELLPVVGLGSWITFNLTPDSADWGPARQVLKLFHEAGGRVIDTAPSYQRSEAFIGEALRDLKLTDDIFIATKVNVAGGTETDAMLQMDNSTRVLGRRPIDLMQVWNLGDDGAELSDRHLDRHLAAVAEWKATGKARYVGITTSFSPQYALVEKAMNSHALDFVQVDFSIGDRGAEDRLLPLARDRGVAVIANRPFTTGNLFQRVSDKTLPPWARDFDCRSWAQFFLKYIVSHPAVVCAIPATNDPAHLADNVGAMIGALPDEATRKRMVQFFSAL